LLIAILQCIKQISVTDGNPTVLLPLTIVLMTVMIKDAVEEINRYNQDRKENVRSVEIYNT
jgi:phospholipid-transporting ATPase